MSTRVFQVVCSKSKSRSKLDLDTLLQEEFWNSEEEEDNRSLDSSSSREVGDIGDWFSDISGTSGSEVYYSSDES